jgi:lipopolysaccharide exporter
MSEPIDVSGFGALQQLLRGSAWQLSLRWAIRLTGLVSTIILARLLTPQDYGVVAIATLIYGTMEIFSQVGVYNAIIRHPNPTREHYDSVWTMSVFLGIGLGLAILALTPLTTFYFHEPRAKPVLEVLALRSALGGFQNVAVLNFQRHFQFRKQFSINVVSTLVGFVAVVVSAFMLRNYWALVIGIMTKQISFLILSYAIEPYMPRFTLSKASELYAFSVWTLFRNIGNYAFDQIDKFAIGGAMGAAEMGRFEAARDLAFSPIAEIVAPLNFALFPVMAKLQNDTQKRREVFLHAFYLSALICSSMAIGMALVAKDAVHLILGAKWDSIGPIVPWLALSGGLLGLTGCVYSLLEAMGRASLSARLQWSRVLVLGLTSFPVAFYYRDLYAVSFARFVVCCAITPSLFIALRAALDMSARDIALVLWRPLMAGLVMAIVVLTFNASVSLSGTPRLIADVMLGAGSFVLTLMVLWYFSGRPSGPEMYLSDRLVRVSGCRGIK